MSGLFGGAKTQAATPTRYNGIQVSTSSSGNCVSLMYGQMRLPFNLMWYGAFSATPTSSSGGGKGGGGQQTTGYKYAASFAAGICEGPITSVLDVWIDKDLTTLSAQGLTLFTGAGGQAVWSYLTSNFSTQAIPYDHICYVGAENYVLGDSAAMPNITFEVKGFGTLSGASNIVLTAVPAAGATSGTLTANWSGATGVYSLTFADGERYLGTLTSGQTTCVWNGPIVASTAPLSNADIIVGGCLDADPSFIVSDYLTDPNHGVGLPTANIGTLTGSNSYQSYCYSLGLFLSPYESTQRAASDFLSEIFQITNSAAVWSAGVLKVIPYADAAVAGNNNTYTPNLTPLYILTDDDFIEPPTVERIPISETYNHIRVEYLDRSNEYNTAIAEATDLGNIAETGERVMDTLSFHEITDSTTARTVAQLQLQTSLYERNTIKMKVRADYALLEPMDFFAITDAGLGYTGQVVQVRKIQDDEDDGIMIEAMEITGYTRTSAIYNWGATQGYNANFGESGGSVQAPAFLEVSGTIVGPNGGIQLWIAVDGGSGNAAYGGCNVYASFDNTTYDQIGQIPGSARYGTITNNITAVTTIPDTSTTMDVTLNNTLGVLGTGSAADAQNNRMLIAVGTGANVEIMSYETATLVTAGQYTLNTFYRSLYGTTVQTHSSGAQFMRLDGSIFALDLDPGWLGQTMYFKFCSFNNVGRGTQDISTATAYTYVPATGTTGFNSVSSSTFVATGSCAVYSPTTAFKQTTGATAWDSTVYSAQSYTNGCTAECYVSQTSSVGLMLGLTLNPTASNSYTNLAYSWYASNGSLYIYEAGNAVAQFGTYTNSDLLALVYDGKHVSYYHNATLIRSVPTANQTFFMQVCIETAGSSVYGLSFDSIATAVTPFTMEPLSVNVACAGTTAQSNNQLATVEWGSRNYQSLESYDNGCQLSFTITKVPTGGQDLILGISLDPTTGDTTGFAYQFGSFLVTPTTVEAYLNPTTNVNIGVAPAIGDVYTINYDNFTVHWWKNGALVAEQYSPNAGNLYLFGDFGSPNMANIGNISFGPYGQLSPNPWFATGDCYTHDSTAEKIGGSNAWDSAVYSLNAYPICHIQFKPSSITLDAMMGLCLNPTENNNYTNLAYAWYANTTGTYEIFEGGTGIGSFGPAAALTDLLAITYDGSNVRYYLNSVLERTVALSGATFFASSSFYSVGMGFQNMSFGPGTTLDTWGTASLDDNAATTVTTASISNISIGVGSGPGGSFQTILDVTVGPFPYATTVVCTMTGTWNTPGTSGVASAVISYLIAPNTTGTGYGTNVIEITTGGTGNNGVLASEQTFSLAANTTTTYYVLGISIPQSSSTATFNAADVTLKCETIKK